MNSSPPLPLPRDFPDWQSPMVVKELRHGLRTRFFAFALIQFHALLALLMGSALLGADQQIIAGVFWGLSLVLVLFVMPLRGFSALRSEVSEGTMDMLTLTNMSAFRMVYGKWIALFSQTLLVASSLLPYMVARYHFGGVEIIAEGVALGLMVLASAVITAALVAFSTQKSVLLRLFLAAGLFFPMLPFGAMGVGVMFGQDSFPDFFAMLAWPEQLGIVGGTIFVTAYATYLFLTLGASRFASPAENHSTTKRLVGLAVMAILGAGGSAVALWYSERYAAVWIFMPTLFFTLALGMDVMTEAMPRVPTVVVKFAHGGWWRRLLGRIFYPGWASGVIFYVLIALAPTAIVASLCYRLSERDPFVIALCLLLANVVPVAVPILKANLFVRWWIVQMVLFISGASLVVLADVMGTRDIAAVGIVTPGTALFASSIRWQAEMAAGGAISGAFWLIAAVYLAITEMRTYSELETDARYCEDIKPRAAAQAHDAA